MAASRLAVVLAVILALVLSGVMAAERLYVESAKAQAAAAADQNKLLPQPSENSDQGSMAKGAGPCSEQAALNVPVGVSPDKDVRNRGLLVSAPSTPVVNVVAFDHASVIQSSALVSSRLAEQFTLLGAKPSGTM